MTDADRIARLERVVALSSEDLLGPDEGTPQRAEFVKLRDEIIADAIPADDRQPTETEVTAWNAVIDGLVAREGWTRDEANTNFGNLIRDMKARGEIT